MYVGTLPQVIQEGVVRKALVWPLMNGFRVGNAWRKWRTDKDNKNLESTRKWHLGGTAAGILGGAALAGPLGASLGAINGANIGIGGKDLYEYIKKKKK